VEGDQSSQLKRCLIKGLCWKVLKHLTFHLISFSIQWAMYIVLLYIGGLYQVPCTKPPTVD
jgi:hypothetical protein